MGALNGRITDEHKAERVAIFQSMSTRDNCRNGVFFSNVTAVDEIWKSFLKPDMKRQSMEAHHRLTDIKMFRGYASAEKIIMVAIFWYNKSVILAQYVTKGTT